MEIKFPLSELFKFKIYIELNYVGSMRVHMYTSKYTDSVLHNFVARPLIRKALEAFEGNDRKLEGSLENLTLVFLTHSMKHLLSFGQN